MNRGRASRAALLTALVSLAVRATPGRAADCSRFAAPPPAPIDCSQAITCGDQPDSLSWTDRPNILLIVTDDHAYCHWGFMSGRCAGDPNRECVANADCTGGVCEANTGAGALRLNTLECRNREPDLVAADKGHFPFDRSAYPTAGTSRALRTPYLDELASQGAVFPRAHVGALSCSLSRHVIALGKFLSHTQAVPTDRRLWPAIAEQLKDKGPNNDACCPGDPPRCDPAACDPGYRAGGFVKPGGFLHRAGGFDEVAPGKGMGKFHCRADASGDVCRDDLASCYECGDRSQVPDVVHCSEDAPELIDPSLPRAKTRGVRKIKDLVEQAHSWGFIVHRFDDGTRHLSRVEHPFYIWYGPNIPHAPGTPEATLLDLYAGREPLVEQPHLGRISWADAGIGALVHYLQHTCVCGKSGVAQSLYDSTVVIVLADQGWLMPGAKAVFTENTERTPIIVNEPRHRGATPAAPATQFTDQLAHAVDLQSTILAYAGITRTCTDTCPAGQACVSEHAGSAVAGAAVSVCRKTCGLASSDSCTDPVDCCAGPYRTDTCYCADGTCVLSAAAGGVSACPAGKTCVCGYPFARNLKPFIEDPTLTLGTSIRDLQFNEGADAHTSVTNRPGLLGVCETPHDNDPAACANYSGAAAHVCLKHFHPCRSDADCGYTEPLAGPPGHADQIDLGHCMTPDRDPRICINQPWQTCSDDVQCASWSPDTGLCDCAHDVTRPGMCLSAGSCRPVADPLSRNHGGYADFDASLPCNSDVDCTPQDVDRLSGTRRRALCKPLILRVVKNDAGPFVPTSGPFTAVNGSAWDLNWDPDEQFDLFRMDKYLLGGPRDSGAQRLRIQLEHCLDHFRGVDVTGGVWAGAAGCPFM